MPPPNLKIISMKSTLRQPTEFVPKKSMCSPSCSGWWTTELFHTIFQSLSPGSEMVRCSWSSSEQTQLQKNAVASPKLAKLILTSALQCSQIHHATHAHEQSGISKKQITTNKMHPTANKQQRMINHKKIKMQQHTMWFSIDFLTLHCWWLCFYFCQHPLWSHSKKFSFIFLIFRNIVLLFPEELWLPLEDEVEEEEQDIKSRKRQNQFFFVRRRKWRASLSSHGRNWFRVWWKQQIENSQTLISPLCLAMHFLLPLTHLPLHNCILHIKIVRWPETWDVCLTVRKQPMWVSNKQQIVKKRHSRICKLMTIDGCHSKVTHGVSDTCLFSQLHIQNNVALTFYQG